MRTIFTVILIAFASTAFGQINTADSSAQVVAYWNLGEKESYSVSFQKLKIIGADTASNETMTYDVDISVVDSTANSYLVEWLYHNFKSNSTNEVANKMAGLSQDMKVLIETDELGKIKGVKNWEDISKYMKAQFGQARKEFKNNPKVDQLFKQMESVYASKEGIEAVAIMDAQQYHAYHGGKFVLGNIEEYSLAVPNVYYPNKPFDSQVSIYLDEINEEDNNFIIRSSQEVDSKQLTTTTIDYLKSIGTPGINEKEIGQLSSITKTASRIHGSGWVIYSVQTKTVEASGAQNIEERIIEIK